MHTLCYVSSWSNTDTCFQRSAMLMGAWKIRRNQVTWTVLPHPLKCLAVSLHVNTVYLYLTFNKWPSPHDRLFARHWKMAVQETCFPIKVKWIFLEFAPRVVFCGLVACDACNLSWIVHYVLFLAWTNNLSDYEDEGYSDVDEEESDEEFNQKSEGNKVQFLVACYGFIVIVILLLIAGRQRRGTRGASDKDVTPPLLAKVHGNLEVRWFCSSEVRSLCLLSSSFPL